MKNLNNFEHVSAVFFNDIFESQMFKMWLFIYFEASEMAFFTIVYL